MAKKDDIRKQAAVLDAAQNWQPIKDLVASLRPAGLAAKVTFDEAGAHLQVTIPWAEVPPELQQKEQP